MKYILTTIAALCCAIMHKAQVTTTLPIDTAKQHGKGGGTLSIGSGGVQFTSKNHDSSVKKTFEVQFGMLDLGLNSFDDKTDYNSAAARDFLHVKDPYANADLFSLRSNKSVNVNIYPILVKAQVYRGARQKITIASGLGMQLYNFRFTKPVAYRSDPTPHVELDTVSFSKNKLAFNYLTVPLMINGKTKIANGKSAKGYYPGYWLTYGIGISGGYLLNSWTKQISDERGKQKNHDPFNFRNTNFCVNGEFGLDGYIRLYASYQLTSLHENGLEQHPVCIGVRFLGI